MTDPSEPMSEPPHTAEAATTPTSSRPGTEALSDMDIDQWIESLRQSDRSFYNLMALEVWSIAKTMDTLQPGFWNRFMANRQTALKQFLEHKKKSQSDGDPPDRETESPEPPAAS